MGRIPVGLLAAFAIGAAAWLVWDLQPDRQIERKMNNLLSAASSRDWKRAARLLSPSYKDAWNQDRAQAMETASDFGRHFLALEILPAEGWRVEATPASGVWRGRLVFSGRGTAIGEMLFSRAGELEEEFVFAWERESWKPWHWLLVSVGQPEIIF
jgi:hypothetical protein